MTGGILRDLENAVAARRAARKEFLAATKRLARRIVESGRVGDRVTVDEHSYAIAKVRWDMTQEGGGFLSDESAKTLVRIDGDHGVSLLELPTPKYAAKLYSETAAWGEDADGDPNAPVYPYFFVGDEELDGSNCLEATAEDHDLFAQEHMSVLREFVMLYHDEAQEYREIALVLDGHMTEVERLLSHIFNKNS